MGSVQICFLFSFELENNNSGDNSTNKCGILMSSRKTVRDKTMQAMAVCWAMAHMYHYSMLLDSKYSKGLTTKGPICKDELGMRDHLFTCNQYGCELSMECLHWLTMTEHDCPNFKKDRLDKGEKVYRDPSHLNNMSVPPITWFDHGLAMFH